MEDEKMELMPLQFALDEEPFGLVQEKITEDMVNKEAGKVGTFELYLIQGSEGLKAYVDENRGSSYTNWEPMDIFHAIEYDEVSCPIDGKIAYLKSIVLEQRYRNNGIGTQVIKEIIAHLTKEKVHYFILQPSPIGNEYGILMNESDLHKEERLRLTRYYQREFGFRQVPTKRALDYPIYFLPLNESGK